MITISNFWSQELSKSYFKLGSLKYVILFFVEIDVFCDFPDLFICPSAPFSSDMHLYVFFFFLVTIYINMKSKSEENF